MNKYLIKVKYSNFETPINAISFRNDFKINDFVIIKTSRGLEIGQVILEPILNNLIKTEVEQLRVPDKEEISLYKRNLEKSNRILEIASKEAKDLKLKMNFIGAEYLLDCSKIYLFYTAEQRVDFRELLKIFRDKYHIKVEFHQLLPRDKARSVGGIGPCGRELCCVAFLKNIENVNLNKAKNQQLPLNISKLSGICGKLMCCLNYEDDTYTVEAKDYPKIGSIITIKEKTYKVLGFNIISKTVKCQDGDSIVTLPLSDFK